MNYQLDDSAVAGKRLGMIVLSTDETLEHDARRVLGDRDVILMHSRIYSHDDVTPETLKTMADAMTQTAALLPTDLDAVAYGCTSGATVIGPEEVERLVQQAQPGTPVTNPMSSVIAALNALGASRIGLVTPYVSSVTAPMRAYLADHGIETVSEVSFGEGDDRRVARISETSTRNAMLEVARAEGVEALFASCTNLRTFGVIEDVEAETGLPVISSNSAMIWNLLRTAGIEAKGWGPGQLYQI